MTVSKIQLKTLCCNKMIDFVIPVVIFLLFETFFAYITCKNCSKSLLFIINSH